MSLFRVSWWVSQLVFTMAAWIEANISVHLQRQKRTSSLHIIIIWQHTVLLSFLSHIDWLIDTWFLFKLKHHREVSTSYKKISRNKNREKFFWVFSTYLVVRKRTSSLSLVQWVICIPSSMQMIGGGSTTSLLVIG